MPITDGAIYNKEWNKKVIKNGIIKKRLQEFKQYRKTEDYTEKALKIKASDCRQRPRHSAEDFSLKEAKSQYFQDF